MKAIDTYEYRGCTIEVHHDPDPLNPRKECDNVGTMVCWHRRYDLGDEQPRCDGGEFLRDLVPNDVLDPFERRADRVNANWHTGYGRRKRLKPEVARELLSRIEAATQKAIEKWLAENLIILDPYLYDHSGITMRTSPFSCPWDSGRVGLIYCTMERARKEWGEKYNPGITDAEIRAKALACLEAEVKIYDDYLTGSVYGYETKDPEGNDIDACWGFFGYDETKFHEQHDKCGYMIQQARDSIDNWCDEQAKEANERAYWNEREVITKG